MKKIISKRIFDFTISVLITVLFFPIFLILISLIKLSFSGPAIFRQKRVGKDGGEFILYKFRSMALNAPAYAPKPKEDDSRITKIGRFLRKSGLDELPQFYNVLKGDMSLVGPRPEMPFLIETFKDRRRDRLSIKPGITGLWQISGKTKEPIYYNLEYDLYYIKNQSLFLDLKILFKTLILFFRMLKPAIQDCKITGNDKLCA